MESVESINISVLSHELFNKQYIYQNHSGKPWKLKLPASTSANCHNPDIETELQCLLSLKHELNTVKSSLNDFDILEWSNHTNFTNASAKVLPHLRKHIHPELATQAWCKFYELLSYGNVVPSSAKSGLCSVHLCEAPGGFICALNHFLKSSKRNAFHHTWIANTLNPYYEGNTLDSCIVDDRLISRTLRSWCFGKDNTGDIFDDDFLSCLQLKCNRFFHKRTINLVTADGSLNCQDVPSEQEAIVAPLHFTELLCALTVLSPHGNLVIKMFTLFESHSITFMYILCCLFANVAVIKPATSKAGNSEVYVIAQNYCGFENCTNIIFELKKHLPFQSFIKDEVPFISMSNIPKSFLKQHIECVRFFTEHQIATIQRNIHFYHNMNAEFKSDMKKLQEIVTQQFFDICDIKKVLAHHCVVTSGVLRSNVKSNIKLRPRMEGSFTQRKSTDNDQEMQGIIDNHESQCWISSDLAWLPRMQKIFWWDTAQVVFGKPVQDIHSSLFCTTDVIVQYEHAYGQLSAKTFAIKSQDSDTSIDNKQLIEELLVLVCCANGHAAVIEFETSDPFHTNWISDTFSSNLALICNHVSYAIDVLVLKPIEKVELISANFVFPCTENLKWPELNIRFKLVNCIFYAIKYLAKNGFAIFVLPSALMRLTAQVLWVFSQCFDESLIVPIRSSNSHTHPAILFVGKKFNAIEKYIPSMKHLCDLASKKEQELLELFPITALLHTDKASPFIEALKTANDKCILEATYVLNSKLKQSLP